MVAANDNSVDAAEAKILLELDGIFKLKWFKKLELEAFLDGKKKPFRSTRIFLNTLVQRGPLWGSDMDLLSLAAPTCSTGSKASDWFALSVMVRKFVRLFPRALSLTRRSYDRSS